MYRVVNEQYFKKHVRFYCFFGLQVHARIYRRAGLAACYQSVCTLGGMTPKALRVDPWDMYTSFQKGTLRHCSSIESCKTWLLAHYCFRQLVHGFSFKTNDTEISLTLLRPVVNSVTVSGRKCAVTFKGTKLICGRLENVHFHKLIELSSVIENASRSVSTHTHI